MNGNGESPSGPDEPPSSGQPSWAATSNQPTGPTRVPSQTQGSSPNGDPASNPAATPLPTMQRVYPTSTGGATGASSPPAWHPDPWQPQQWRWWDGHYWSAHTRISTQPTKPKLPAFVSVPVMVAALPTLLGIGLLAFLSPLSIVLGIVPLFIVFPVFWWLDRIEPEPWSSRIHAVLWGGTVAACISVIVNTSVAAISTETIAAVFSAPLIEEFAKGAGILWAVRRKEVDGVMDGIVYAGWVALGFAVVEDFVYFAGAADQGLLAQTFFLRALLTPFAHPLFTAWTGLAIGIAISRQRSPIAGSMWGLALAVGTHMAWNGSLTFAESSENAWVVLVALALFILLFVAAAVTVVQIRRTEQAHFHRLVPFMAQRYRMGYNEVAAFQTWSGMKGTRSQLARPQRRQFDAVHAALARLSQLHSRKGEIDAASEQVLYQQLEAARRGE